MGFIYGQNCGYVTEAQGIMDTTSVGPQLRSSTASMKLHNCALVSAAQEFHFPLRCFPDSAWPDKALWNLAHVHPYAYLQAPSENAA